jgi:hypothetical protein
LDEPSGNETTRNKDVRVRPHEREKWFTNM